MSDRDHTLDVELLRRDERFVRAVALRLVRDRHDADDVVQQTWLAALERRPDSVLSLRPWLATVARNVALRLRRGERRREVRQGAAARPEGIEATEELVQRFEVRRLVADAVAALEEPYRSTLLLRYFEDVPPRRIAELQFISVGTVKTRLHRALKLLRSRLDAHFEGDGRRCSHVLLGLLDPAELLPFASKPAASSSLTATWATSAAVVVIVATGFFFWSRAQDEEAEHLITDRPGVASSEVNSEPLLESSPSEPSPEKLAESETSAQRAVPTSGTEAASSSVMPIDPVTSGGALPKRTNPIPHHPSFEGRVIDEAGAPIAGVLVVADPAPAAAGLRRTFTTQANGEFHFDLPSAFDGVRIHAEHEDYARELEGEHYVWLRADTIEPLEIVLYAPMSVEGVVVDEAGAEVGDSEVILITEWIAGSEKPVQYNQGQVPRHVTTDASGRFVIDRLRPGRIGLCLEHPSFAQTRHVVEVSDSPFHLTIRDGLRLEGRVFHRGNTLSDVTIVCNGMRLGGRPIGDWNVKTDEAGRFSIGPVPSLFDVMGEDFLSRHVISVVSVRVEDTSWTSPVYRVYQPRAGSLPFVKIDAEPKPDELLSGDFERPEVIDVGRPSEEAPAEPPATASLTVELEDWPWRGFEELKGSVRLDLWTEGQGLKRWNGDFDPSGRVTVGPLPAGEPQVSVRLGVAKVDFPRVCIEPGEQRVIRIPRPGSKVFGNLTPWPSKELELHWKSEPRDRTAPRWHGFADLVEPGYEIFGMRAGRVRLFVTGPSRMPFEAALDHDGRERRLDLEMPTGKIEVHLAEPFQARHPSIFVRPQGISPSSGNLGAWIETEEPGPYVVEAVPPGRYTISTATELSLEAEARLERAGQHVVVELKKEERVGTLSGRIRGLDASEAGPVGYSKPGVAAFRLRDTGYDFGQWRSVDVDLEDGRYRFDELPEGTWGLLYHGVGKPHDTSWISGIRVGEGDEVRRDLTIPANREVLIDVDYDHRVPPRANWWLILSDGTAIPDFVLVGSQPDGRHAPPSPFRLPLGSYRLKLDFGDRRDEIYFELMAGDERHVVSVRP